MGRPKGSKNAKKEVKAVKEDVAPVVIPPEEVKKPHGHGLGEWKPSPDMGGNTRDLTKCAECGHERSMHYEGEHDWCNTPNCRCGAWRA